MRRWVAAVLFSVGCGSHGGNVDIDAASGLQIDAPAHAVDADLTAPTDTPVVACTDTAAAVAAATPQQGAAPGTILACSTDASIAMAALPAMVGANVSVTSAVTQFQIAYQTRDGAGGSAVSTARVYLPSTPIARPVPLVVAGHGSVGLADSCAPSSGVDQSLPLPYAAGGFAVIAPDLAGLGNAGTQDYLDNRVQGQQMLDGVRALRKLLSPGITAQDVILTGYSQGGGASLSAQSLFRTDGSDLGHLVATAVYAPEWPIQINSFGYIDMLRTPTGLTIATGLSFSSVAVMRQFAFFEDHVGVGQGVMAEPSQYRTGLASAIAGSCLVELGAYIQLNMLYTGNLIDDTLRTGVLACVDSQGPDAGCTGNALAYYNALANDTMTPDPSAGPVLIVQGGLDQIMPPATQAACIKAKLVSSGVDTSACVFSGSDHSNIMDQHASGVNWAESVYAGGPRVLCDQSTQLPTCSN